MYDILGIFKNLDPKMTPVKEDVKTEPTYENVEPRGSIMEAVKNLEEKYMGFKKTVAAIAKGGSAEDPEAVAAAIGRKKYGKKKFQKAAAAGKKLGEGMEAKPNRNDFKTVIDYYQAMAYYYGNCADNATGELRDKYDALQAQYQDKVEAHYDSLDESAKPDFLDLDDDGDTDEPMKDAAKDAEPAVTDKSKAEKRKRLQALKDKQEDERAEKGDYDDKKSSARVVKGRAYGGAAQKDDDKDELDEYTSPYAPDPQARALKDVINTVKGPSGLPLDANQLGQIGQMSTAWNKKDANTNYRTQPGQVRLTGKNTQPAAAAVNDDLDEVAPPGAKAERMVKHIKKGYAKDGKLSKKEKGIAYATAWKAHKAGKLQESVMIQESDYTYERIAKALADKNPTLNTAGDDFRKAVYDELLSQHMKTTVARNLMLDPDFLGDVATSYGHYCKEIAECGSPINSFVEETPVMDAQHELDEISRLAGLPVKETEVYNDVNVEESPDTMDEALNDEAKLERYHELIKQGMDPDDAEVEVFNDEGDEDLDEDTVGEGNEFSGALAKARAAGAKEFEVDGKKYTVKEDVNINISANGEEDAMNLIRKLAGMPEVEVDEARDVEYTNTPREETAGVDAAIPAGADLNRAKKQYKKEYPGDNPMAVKEEALWKAYESLISEIKD